MKSISSCFQIGFAALISSAVLKAELIVFENGDQLKGSIVSLDTKELKLQNTNLGLVTIPREKIRSIVLKEPSANMATPTNQLPVFSKVPSATNDPVAQLRSGIDPRMLEQVQNQFLGTATPEAQALFNDMLSGLASGRMNLDNIREQARVTLEELKKVQGDLDEDENELFGMYAGILERFIAQGTNAAPQIKTNNPPPAKPALKQSGPGKLEFQTPPRKSQSEEN